MTDFNHILNWELKAGSHEFPGPAGGTCINEAAIVAAGFEYRKVTSAGDCPPCFCPVLSQFAIHVNDCLQDGARQELLMPLIVRLAGSYDLGAAHQRAAFILAQIDERLMKPLARVCTVHLLRADDSASAHKASLHMRSAHQCLESANLFGLLQAITHAVKALSNLWNISSSYQARFVEVDALSSLMVAPMFAGPTLASATIDYTTVTFTPREVWTVAAAILAEAFDIGRQAPALDTVKVVERMAKAKAASKCTASA